MCATSSKKKPPGIYGLKPHIKAIPEKNFPSLKLDDLKKPHEFNEFNSLLFVKHGNAETKN